MQQNTEIRKGTKKMMMMGKRGGERNGRKADVKGFKD